MTTPKEECEDCGKVQNVRSLVRKKGKLICYHCSRKNSNIIMSMNPLRVPKIVREELKREPKIKKEPIRIPKIKGEKNRVKKTYYGFSKVEKQVLLRKYMSKGLDFERARAIVVKDNDFIKDLINKLKAKGKNDSEINIRFKEEFSKLVESEKYLKE